jgi:hypothetical protein
MKLVLANRPNKEGFVLSWDVPGQVPIKVKVKHEDFLRLQKLVHDATPKNILQALIDHDAEKLSAWSTSLSPELSKFINKKIHQFQNDYAFHKSIVKGIMFNILESTTTRKEFAIEVNSCPVYKKYASVCFATLDQDQDRVRKMTWKLVAEDVKDNRPLVEEE